VNPEDRTRVGTAFLNVTMRTPEVIPLKNGGYACGFEGLMIKVTPEEWDVIDTAIRAGIKAHQEGTK